MHFKRIVIGCMYLINNKIKETFEKTLKYTESFHSIIDFSETKPKNQNYKSEISFLSIGLTSTNVNH